MFYELGSGVSGLHLERSASLAFFAALLASSSAQGAELFQGWCRQATCNWFSIEEKDAVAYGPDGVLYAVRVKQWYSDLDPNTGKRSGKRRFAGERTSYTYCSKTRPADISDFEGEYLVTLHAPNQESTYAGYTFEPLQAYFSVCHAVNFLTDPRLGVQLAQRLGYNLPVAAAQQTRIKAVKDILTIELENHPKPLADLQAPSVASTEPPVSSRTESSGEATVTDGSVKSTGPVIPNNVPNEACDLKNIYSQLEAAVKPKSEFETEAEFAERAQREVVASGVQLRNVFCDLGGRNLIRYDAEKKGFRGVAMQLRVQDPDLDLGSYEATSAMGVKVIIYKSQYEVWVGEFPKGVISGFVPMSPDSAKRESETLRFGYVVNVIPPFHKLDRYTTTPKVTDPRETTVIKRSIYMQPLKLVAYNAVTREILWSGEPTTCPVFKGSSVTEMKFGPCSQ
jgi:hypothetical protein